jgi:hypothetical protein
MQGVKGKVVAHPGWLTTRGIGRRRRIWSAREVDEAEVDEASSCGVFFSVKTSRR